MEIITLFIDLFLHLDKHLSQVIQEYGPASYILLFVIIFMETGLVVTPFLPGDSLLFAAGTFASPALGLSLNIWILYPLLFFAAVLGDTVNYWIGHFLGERAFQQEHRFLKREYLERTHAFYERHGGKTIVLARFIPIIRTFAPFVAGVAEMNYFHFISYNVVGGFLWVTLFTWGGYYFGNLPLVKNNFGFVVVAIVLISVMPALVEAYKERRRAAKVSL